MVRGLALSLSMSLIVGSAGVPTAAWAQTDEAKAGARAAATSGHQAMTEGRWKDAIDLFERAEALVHAPPHLLYIARAQAKLGRLVTARETYIRIAREEIAPNAPAAFKDARADAEKELNELSARIANLKISVEGGGEKKVTVFVNGAEMPAVLVGIKRPIDPGKREIRATAEGLESQVVTVDVKEGANEEVVLVLKPPAPKSAPVVLSTETSKPKGPPPNGMLIGGIVAAGVGVIGLGLGTVFLLQNHSKRDEADALCPNGVCPRGKQTDIEALDGDANSAGTLSLVGYAVGGAALAAGVTLIVLSGKKTEKPVTAMPFVGPSFVGVAGRF